MAKDDDDKQSAGDTGPDQETTVDAEEAGPEAEVVSFDEVLRRQAERRGAAEGTPPAGLPPGIRDLLEALAEHARPFADESGHIQFDLAEPEQREEALNMLKDMGLVVLDTVRQSVDAELDRWSNGGTDSQESPGEGAGAAEQASPEGDTGPETSEAPPDPPRPEGSRPGGTANPDKALPVAGQLIGAFVRGLLLGGQGPEADGSGMTLNFNINLQDQPSGAGTTTKEPADNASEPASHGDNGADQED